MPEKGSPKSNEEPPPFFIIGAPRSGTTYLTEVLNRHPEVFVTNETRIMTWVNRALNVVPSDPWILHKHRDDFLSYIASELPSLIRQFYLSLGAPVTARWGDKHPHYADSKSDPDCLDTIDRLYPNSQFVHIIRNGVDVVSSIVSKNWAGLTEAIDVWRRHVVHATAFGRRIGPQRMFHITYEDLVNNGESTTEGVLHFLELEMTSSVTEFLREQEQRRTPFSRPTADLGSVSSTPLSPTDKDDIRKAVIDEVGPLLAELGYT